MLNYLDGYPIELPCRYANKIACYTHVYLITNIPLERQYEEVQKLYASTWQAFLRRINKVIYMTDKVSYIYSVDEYKKKDEKFINIDKYQQSKLPFVV